MHSLGYGDDELKEAFLCGKSERTGGYFDYFRGRIIFPIIDNFSNVIAFGGRALGDGKPKYLNTSDTPVFKKSRNLFALNFARNACADSLILCEGYMDVIAVHMAGFPNAVATLGTALTTEQARLMAKYTKKVILSYDSDEAGVSAAKRAIPILTDAGLEVKMLRMEGAKDPDEYIKKPLSQRWHKWGHTGVEVHRDIMSAFLACYADNEKGHDRALLLSKWPAVEALLRVSGYCRQQLCTIDTPSREDSRDQDLCQKQDQGAEKESDVNS